MLWGETLGQVSAVGSGSSKYRGVLPSIGWIIGVPFELGGTPLLHLGPLPTGFPGFRAADGPLAPLGATRLQCRGAAGESDASLRALADILLGPRPPPNRGLPADERPAKAPSARPD